jgi:hypothetical protein
VTFPESTFANEKKWGSGILKGPGFLRLMFKKYSMALHLELDKIEKFG